MKKESIISQSNIISEKVYKEKINSIFKEVSAAVANTLGPFGKNTIIEQFGEMHVTKDGWTVLKGINFQDNIDNNILYLLTKIASQVVINVGDGSTSSIVAAEEILKEFEKSNIINMNFSPREFTQVLNKVVSRIINEIKMRSIRIRTTSEEDKLIYNLAYISTNGNEEISSMISDIYKETGNPSISYYKGNYANHQIEIIDGYKSDIRLLDGIYINNDQGERVEAQPQILLFDFKVDEELLQNLIYPIREKMLDEGKLLYIIAPYYTDSALQRIKSETTLVFKNTNGKFINVYCKSSLISNYTRQLYSDLACLLGATIIDTTKAQDLLNIEDIENRKEELYKCLGTCETVTSNMKTSTFSGFIKKDEAMFNILMNDAVSKYNETLNTTSRMDVVSPDIINLKNRISKLKCKMGVINVGGLTTLEQSANYDLVDDAVKACENAYSYGYNVGCNLIITFITEDLLKESEWNENERKILTMIHTAFVKVYMRVIENKYIDAMESEAKEISEKIASIVKGSYETRLPYDLIKCDYSDKIINPSNTDIEILKASCSMVSLILTSNQYIKINLPPR